jgi:hypothetical protein
MPSRSRKRPLAQFEHGTRIHPPTPGEPRFRVVSTDPVTGSRVFAKCRSEMEARAKAREFEQLVAQAGPRVDTTDWSARTVGVHADRYVKDHLSGLSLLYREKQEYLLESWILPRLGSTHVLDWTAADSAGVLAAVRGAGMSDALIQDVGSAMRGLVTHARRLRWLTATSEDPLWMVKYSKRGTVQGAAVEYIPRVGLPTDAQCAALFAAMAALDPTWALAMALKHRCGARWGELVALNVDDVVFSPRVIHIRRAVEQGRRGVPALKPPKNGRVRTTIFPKSLEADLRAHVEARRVSGGAALLFPGRNGQLMRRSTFQSIWVRAADAAGWPMVAPLERTAGYGQKGKGWRWKGSAQWSPHDLRHVAACWMLFDLALDPAVVAAKLGHADPSFTVKRYVGVRGDPDLAAMDVTDRW